MRNIITLLLVLFSFISHAQVPSTAAGYAFFAYQGTYTPISGGTTLSSLHTDDAVVGSIPIGFTFPYAGGTYTTLSASSNGWLSLNNYTSSSQTGNTTTAMNTISPSIFPLWDDMHGSIGTASYVTTGTAPNRVFTFQWSSWRWYYTVTGDVISFQAKLYESGRIEFIYKEGLVNVGGSAGASIGIGKSTSDYKALTNATTSPTASSTSFTININTRPANGQVYAFDAPCTTPSGMVSGNITNKAATVSWNGVASSQGYEYVLSQSATPPAGAGTATTATFQDFSGLTSNTTYYFHLRNKCNSASLSSWVTHSFTTLGCKTPTNVLISNVTNTSADVLWSQVPYPAADVYEYALDFSKENPASGITTTTAINKTFAGLIPNSKYYFHIRSRCLGSDSSGWRVDSFITQMTCYPPIVQVNDLGSNNPKAYWDPIPTAIAYEYALTHTSNIPAYGIEIYNTSVSPELPIDGQDYYLHVRAKCNSMFTTSAWSTVALRTNTTGINIVSAIQSIEVFPNPVQDMLHLKGAKGMSYSIADMAGRVMLQGVSADNETLLNVGELPAGIYLLSAGDNSDSRKFRFVRQ